MEKKKKSHWAKKGIEEEKKGSQTRPLREALFSLACIPLCENMTIQLVLHFIQSVAVFTECQTWEEPEEGGQG